MGLLRANWFVSLTVQLTNYSAFRQTFPKLWTSVAHSFLQQIAQNKNWAHPKATTSPRICKVEMQRASLLYYSAKPQSGRIWGCALRHCTSEPFDSRRFVEACRAYSLYPAWSRCRRSGDVPRTDHDRVGWSPWQMALRSEILGIPFFHLFDFSTSQNAATAFAFKHKKTIDVTDLFWPKTICYRF